MEQDRRKAWGFSLFGDDLRNEAGGKLSLMGMYQNDMIFHGTGFPILVPRFVILIMYYEIVDAIKGDVAFKVSYPEEANLVADMQIPKKDMPLTQLTHEAEVEGEERIIHIRVPIILSPFPLERPGRLRVRAQYSDGAILKLGSINIKSMTPEELKAFQEQAMQAFQKSESN
jgi:hypothetical protein